VTFQGSVHYDNGSQPAVAWDTDDNMGLEVHQANTNTTSQLWNRAFTRY
jgi:hypothetical protein